MFFSKEDSLLLRRVKKQLKESNVFEYKEITPCKDIWCKLEDFSLHFIESPIPTLEVYVKDGQPKSFVYPSRWTTGNKTAQSRWKKYNELKHIMYLRHNNINTLVNNLSTRQIVR